MSQDVYKTKCKPKKKNFLKINTYIKPNDIRYTCYVYKISENKTNTL